MGGSAQSCPLPACSARMFESWASKAVARPVGARRQGLSNAAAAAATWAAARDFEWQVPNFSMKTGVLVSPAFSAVGARWMFGMYPTGGVEGAGTHTSLSSYPAFLMDYLPLKTSWHRVHRAWQEEEVPGETR